MGDSAFSNPAIGAGIAGTFMGPVGGAIAYGQGSYANNNQGWDKGTNGAWDSRIADPGGWHGGRGLLGGGGIFGSGWDPFGWSDKDKEDTRGWLQKLQEDNPQLFQQLNDQAAGKGGSAAEELGKAQIERNQRAMLSTGITAEGANPAAVLRSAMQSGERVALEGGQQIMAMRAQEQHNAQAMLLDAMMKGASLDDAMTMFRAQMAAHREDMRNQMMAQGLGAGLAAYTSYGAQQNNGYGADWAAAGNMGAGGGARGPYGGGTFQGNYGAGNQNTSNGNVDAPMYGQGGSNEPAPWF